MLNIHAPEAEAVHDLTEGVVVVVEFDRAGHVEDDLRVGAHVESVDGAGHLSDVVTWLALPGVPWISTLVCYHNRTIRTLTTYSW